MGVVGLDNGERRSRGAIIATANGVRFPDAEDPHARADRLLWWSDRRKPSNLPRGESFVRPFQEGEFDDQGGLESRGPVKSVEVWSGRGRGIMRSRRPLGGGHTAVYSDASDESCWQFVAGPPV